MLFISCSPKWTELNTIDFKKLNRYSPLLTTSVKFNADNFYETDNSKFIDLDDSFNEILSRTYSPNVGFSSLSTRVAKNIASYYTPPVHIRDIFHNTKLSFLTDDAWSSSAPIIGWTSATVEPPTAIALNKFAILNRDDKTSISILEEFRFIAYINDFSVSIEDYGNEIQQKVILPLIENCGTILIKSAGAISSGCSFGAAIMHEIGRIFEV